MFFDRFDRFFLLCAANCCSNGESGGGFGGGWEGEGEGVGFCGEEGVWVGG